MLDATMVKLAGACELSANEAYELASAMLHQRLTMELCMNALASLQARGESAAEIEGFVRALRERARPVTWSDDSLIDTCGTGGDGLLTFNVSTVSAIVVAAAGGRVAKHCNRAVTGRCGSADLLNALRIRFDGPAEFAGRSLDAAGVAFLYAPHYHPDLRALSETRRRLGTRTIFNIAGPLANPASVTRQVVGVFSRRLVRIVAEVLHRRGASHCLVVHGDDGSDEIAVNGPTHVCEVRGGTIRESEIGPVDFDLAESDREQLRAEDADASAALALEVLHGRGLASRTAVLMNAGAAIYVAGRATSLTEGARAAARAIDSGAALDTLATLQRLSREP